MIDAPGVSSSLAIKGIEKKISRNTNVNLTKCLLCKRTKELLVLLMNIEIPDLVANIF
jgi:hypothetical protein